MQELALSILVPCLFWLVAMFLAVYIPSVFGAAAYSIAVRIEWRLAYDGCRCMASWSHAHPMTWRFAGMNFSPYRVYDGISDYDQVSRCIFEPGKNTELCFKAWGAVWQHFVSRRVAAQAA